MTNGILPFFIQKNYSVDNGDEGNGEQEFLKSDGVNPGDVFVGRKCLLSTVWKQGRDGGWQRGGIKNLLGKQDT